MRFSEQILDSQADQSKLPPQTVAKLEVMRDARDAAVGISRKLFEDSQHAKKILDGVRSERVRLISETASQRPNPQRLAKIDEAIEAQQANYDRLRAKVEAAQKAATAIGEPVRRMESWIDENRQAKLEACTSLPDANKGAGESWLEAIERIRADIAGIKADIHQTTSAPIPTAEAIAAMRAEIEELADAGAPDPTRCLEGGSVRWATSHLLNHSGQIIVASAVNVAGLFVWLHKDALIEKLTAEIKASANPSKALTTDQRATEILHLEKALLKAERLEESAIVVALLGGTTVPRRADADPRAVLELADGASHSEDAS